MLVSDLAGVKVNGQLCGRKLDLIKNLQFGNTMFMQEKISPSHYVIGIDYDDPVVKKLMKYYGLDVPYATITLNGGYVNIEVDDGSAIFIVDLLTAEKDNIFISYAKDIVVLPE